MYTVYRSRRRAAKLSPCTALHLVLMALLQSKALSSKGHSQSWSSQQRNVVRIFNLMAEQDEKLSLLEEHSWDKLPEQMLCSTPVYERYAYYLLEN